MMESNKATSSSLRMAWWKALWARLIDGAFLGQVLLGLVMGLLLISNIRLIDNVNRLEQRIAEISTVSSSQTESMLRTDAVMDIRTDLGAAKGPESAPVTIVEFSDFQCPYCAASGPVLTRLFEKYPGKIRLIFRHFPLPGHIQAMPAAEAAECARDQGKFWEMHDLLFQHQEELVV